MKRVFIIAEAGVNHNGSMALAMKMVDEAVKAGADAIKFQTYRSENVISRYAPKADYQKELTNPEESQLEMVRKFELGFTDHQKLADHCAKKKILFLSSPFDLESIDMLAMLGLKVLKIPSGEITNLPYLRKIGALKNRLILSTGMATLKEVGKAIWILRKAGTRKQDITVLHCNTEYPTPYKDVNLRAMATMKKVFNTQVGYSDHSVGIEVPIAAVALGAAVIEKHFTLDRNMTGPDHKASMEPDQFALMVKSIRNIESSLGDGVKRPSRSETKNMPIARKSIIASRKIRSGETFSEENITVKRPGTGTSPMKWDRLLGKRAMREYAEDEIIRL